MLEMHLKSPKILNLPKASEKKCTATYFHHLATYFKNYWKHWI